MVAVEVGLGITNYFGMFSGSFGQTVRPTFSKLHVCTDSINVDTYEVSDLGVATPFDSFKIIKSNAPNSTQNVSENNIGFYPVPVKDCAFLTFKDVVNSNVEIYSLSGSLVETLKVDGSTQIVLSIIL